MLWVAGWKYPSSLLAGEMHREYCDLRGTERTYLRLSVAIVVPMVTTKDLPEVVFKCMKSLLRHHFRHFLGL